MRRRAPVRRRRLERPGRLAVGWYRSCWAPWRRVGIRAVLHVDERQDHPGPGSVCAGIGEPRGELRDMAAQFGQGLIGQPECAPVQVNLPAMSRLPGLVRRRYIHRGSLQYRSEERGGFLRAGIVAGRLTLCARIYPFGLAAGQSPIAANLDQPCLLQLAEVVVEAISWHLGTVRKLPR